MWLRWRFGLANFNKRDPALTESLHPVSSDVSLTRVGSRVAPAQAIVAASVLSLGIFVFEIWLAILMPWLGLELAEPKHGPGIVVSDVFAGGPADGRLKRGDLIVAFETAAGERVAVSAVTITRATYALQSYADFNQFFRDHAALFRAIQQPTVWAVLADGTGVELEPNPRRAIFSLPADFWAMDLLAALALLIGVGVLAFQPRDPASRMFFIVCIGGVLTAAMMALGKSRELTFHASWVDFLWAVDQFGKYLAQFGLVALLWVYPRPFRALKYLVPIGLLYLLAWVAGILQWWPTPRTSAPLVMSVTLFAAMAPLAVWQWRAARADLVDRAALKILLATVMVPIALVVFTNRLPIMLGYPPVVYSGVSVAAMLLVVYAGFAVGVARYRLFKLDRWWFEALVWGLGGGLVVLFDGLLLWFQTNASVALGVALAVAGWIYFPVRQWLWQRLSPEAQQTVEQHLPTLIETLFSASSHRELAADWETLLERIYAPLSVARDPQPCATAVIAEDGRALKVPTLLDDGSIVLFLSRKGQRLFSPADEQLARTLFALARQATAARVALDQRAAETEARQREREHVVQELHDGLGGIATNIRLLATIAQKDAAAPDVSRRLATIVELADASLAEIRTFMYSLDETDADWPAFVADLRAYGRKLIEPHGLAFEMTSRIAGNFLPPDPVLRLNITRIYQEALTNVVKHARAQRVGVQVAVADGLELIVEDDGVGLPDEVASTANGARARSRGLSNLQRRAEHIGARLELVVEGGTRVRLTLPLTAGPAGAEPSRALF